MTNQNFLETFVAKEAQRFKMKVGVFLFLMRQDEILLLRRYRTGIEDGMYVVPMGGHDGKEPLTHAVIREAEEEAGVSMRAKDLSVCHVMHRYHKMPQGLSFEQMDIFFKAEKYDGVITNREPDRCDELKFFSLHALPMNTSAFIKRAIMAMQNGQVYSEFGWENDTKNC